MDNQDNTNQQAEQIFNIDDLYTDDSFIPNMNKKKRKKHPFRIFFLLLIIIIIIGGGGTYYFIEKSKPEKVAKEYLDSMKLFDIKNINTLTMAGENSVINNKQLLNPAFDNFFKAINKKLQYKIQKTDFNILNGTANVYVKVSYINGESLLKDAGTDFIRQIASNALSGKSLTAQQIETVLTETLNKHSQMISDDFITTTLVIPMMKHLDNWKVARLLPEIPKILSANYEDIEEGIKKASATPTVPPAPAPEAVIDLNTDKFQIKFSSAKVVKDISEKPAIVVYYTYTNKSTEDVSPMVDVRLSAFQNNKALEPALPIDTIPEIDQYMNTIGPNESKVIAQCFCIYDANPVILQVQSAFDMSNSASSTQLINLPVEQVAQIQAEIQQKQQEAQAKLQAAQQQSQQAQQQNQQPQPNSQPQQP